MELQGKTIAIIATDLFENAELVDTRKALDDAGAETVLISTHEGDIQGVNHDERADKVTVDLLLEDVSPEDYHGLLLPGGAMNADALRVEPLAQSFVQAFDKAGKPVAAICHAPWLLISAGLVKGRHLTSYHTIADDIKNAGGEWTDEPVVTDRNWVTSRQPDDIPAFNEGMIELFKNFG